MPFTGLTDEDMYAIFDTYGVSLYGCFVLPNEVSFGIMARELISKWKQEHGNGATYENLYTKMQACKHSVAAFNESIAQMILMIDIFW